MGASRFRSKLIESAPCGTISRGLAGDAGGGLTGK